METDAVRIIQTILSYKFDTARAYIAGVIREQKPVLTDADIRIIINYELGILKELIAQNMSTEIVHLPELTDQKYNHWEAFQYILSRHYMDRETLDNVPEYYRRVCMYVRCITRKDTCAQVVDRVIEMTNPELIE